MRKVINSVIGTEKPQIDIKINRGGLVLLGIAGTAFYSVKRVVRETKKR